jgi:hypothetical protein
LHPLLIDQSIDSGAWSETFSHQVGDDEMAAISWANPTNGDWSLGTNWSTGAAPSLLDDATISVAGSYPTTISSIDVADSLTVDAAQASVLETAGELIMVRALTVEAGSVSFNTANIIGSVVQSGGVIAFSNGGALGAGTVSMTGGELLGAANVTLGNTLNFSVTATLAATHGTTLNEDSTTYTLGRNTTLDIGSQGEDGTVVWSTSNTSTVVLPTTDSVNVQAGTLKAGADSFRCCLASSKPRSPLGRPSMSRASTQPSRISSAAVL